MGMAVSINGGVLSMGVIMISALPLGVHTRLPSCVWNNPKGLRVPRAEECLVKTHKPIYVENHSTAALVMTADT